MKCGWDGTRTRLVTGWWPKCLEGRGTIVDCQRGRRGSSFGVGQAWGFLKVVLMSPVLAQVFYLIVPTRQSAP